MRTFAIVNQKGGCGKTTTAINLSAIFAHRGLRTLLVDMDPQGHCATGLGVPEQGIDKSAGEALLEADDEGLDPGSFLWEVAGNLDLIPSTMRLAGLEAPGGGLHALPDRDRRLARLLERLAGRYDRCIIDCPPTIGLLTFNALRAAREAIIPVETGFFALRGAEKQWRTIRQLIERIGRPIACHLVPTLFRAESALATDILSAIRRQFAGQVLPVVVHEDEVVREAASFGQPVIEYAPQSQARRDFEELADWLEDHAPHPSVQIEVVAPARQSQGGLPPKPEPAVASAAPPGPPAVEGRAAELARRVRRLHGAGVDEPQSEPVAAPDLAGPVTPAEIAVLAAPVVTPSEIAAGAAPVVASAPCAADYGAVPTEAGVRFAQPGDARQTISVAGDFNGWSATATPLAFDDRQNAHAAIVEIPPGRYRYRIVVDGRWLADPYNASRQTNAYDEPNSVLVVPEAQDAT